jgi:hypothetical protein
MQNQVARVSRILEHVQASVLGCDLFFYVKPDPFNKTIAWVQPSAVTLDSVGGGTAEFTGREYKVDGTMTDDEVLHTLYIAYKVYAEHELMEGFKFRGVSVFSPHYRVDDLVKLWEK